MDSNSGINFLQIDPIPIDDISIIIIIVSISDSRFRPKKTPIELVKIQCVKVFPSNCTNISLDYWKLARFVRLFFVRLPYYCVFCGGFVFLLWFIHNIYILFGILKDFNNSHQIGTPPYPRVADVQTWPTGVLEYNVYKAYLYSLGFTWLHLAWPRQSHVIQV